MPSKLSRLPEAALDATGVWERVLRVAEQEKLRAGDQLPSVRSLAERLQVKATQVRDALLQAQAKGAVKIVPRIGAFLETTSPAARTLTSSLNDAAHAALARTVVRESHDLLQLLDARRLIEVELVGRAAERRRLEEMLPARRALETLMLLPLDAPRADYVASDIEFHTALARLSGNAILAGVQETLMQLLRPYLLDVPPTAQHRTSADRSHAAIYAAVVDSDAERARREMRDHLSMAYDSLLRDLRQPPQHPIHTPPTT
ncbi:MAG: FCD domain-containing protein [Planctomycetia bacterium]|nr:FCD domain-containing protein [Planctomycetia bacterium]